MNRFEKRWSWNWVAMALLWGGVAGCSSSETAQNTPPRPAPPVVQANAAPLPDFHQYVVGALEEPTANDRDPFAELRGASPKSPYIERPHRRGPIRFTLRGIVERDGRRVALFARGSVGVGETLAGWTVTGIEERSVVLRRGSSEKRLSL